MNLLKLLNELGMLIQKIDDIANVMESNLNKGLQDMQELMKQIQSTLPDLFFFVERTEIGDKESIISVLKDIMEGMQSVDSVLLLDALIFGLQSMLFEYYEIIKGALYDE